MKAFSCHQKYEFAKEYLSSEVGADVAFEEPDDAEDFQLNKTLSIQKN